MARTFEVAPQTIVLGTATNGFTLTFYEDPTDHSICKMTVTGRAGTLANDTLCIFPRRGSETLASRTTTIPTADTTGPLAANAQIGSGGDNFPITHGGGFGV
jgi:hypothetical protein